MTTVKITELTDIGANLATSTVVPVVNMAGTPTTQKTNIGNIANIILEGAGVDYPEASVALIAQTVSNAAQPNITSVGTLTTVAISGNASVNGNLTSNGTAYVGNLSTTGIATITTLSVGTTANLGAVGNVKITGGTAGQVLSTDGAGNLSWATDTGGNVQSIIANGSSNVSIPTSGGNISISIGGTDLWSFDGQGHFNLSDDSYIGNIEDIGSTGFNMGANTDFAIRTTDGNTSYIWEFGVNGEMTVPDQANGQASIVSRLGNSALSSFLSFATPGSPNLVLGTTGNNHVVINTDKSNANVRWSFDDTGNLTLPGNTFAVNYANGTAVTIPTVGNIATINLTGSNSNVLYGNGVFAPVTGGNSSYGDSNVVSLMAAFGSNTITTTGNISGGNLVTGGQVVANGNVSSGTGLSTGGFLSVDGNTDLHNTIVTGNLSATGNITANNLGNISSINIDGSNTNVLYGNGVFAAVAGGNANTGNVTFDDNIVIGTGDEFGGDGLYLAVGPDSIANGTVQYLRVRGGDYPTHIHLDTGNNQYYDQYFGADGRYVKLEANGNVVINADDYLGNSATWTLTTDGNLILAGGNSVIQSIANSSLDPTLPNVSTMVLTPDANYNSQVLVLDPTAPGHIHLRAYAFSNIDEPAANIFLGGEDTAFEVTSGANNQAVIHSNGKAWTFGNDGNISSDTLTFTTTFANVKTVEYQTAGVWDLYVEDGITGSNTASSRLNVSFKDNLIDKPQVYIENTKESDGIALRWTFDENGNLNFPRDVAGNSDPYLNIFGGSTPTIQSTDVSLAGPANLAIQSDYLNLSGSTGNRIILQADAGAIATDAAMVLSTNLADPGNIVSWTLDTTGNLTLPDTTSVIANVSITLEANDSGNITGLSVIGDANANLYAHGNVTIVSDSSNTNATWTLDTTGNLTLPGNLVIAGNTSVFGTNASLLQTTDDRPLLALSSGANGAVSSLWVEDIGNVGTSNIAAVYANPTVGSGIVRIAVGQNGGNTGPNLWDFGADGNLTLPTSGHIIVSGGIVGSGASPAPYISGFDSIGALEFTNGNSNVTVTANATSWTFGTNGNLTLPEGGIVTNNIPPVTFDILYQYDDLEWDGITVTFTNASSTYMLGVLALMQAGDPITLVGPGGPISTTVAIPYTGGSAGYFTVTEANSPIQITQFTLPNRLPSVTGIKLTTNAKNYLFTEAGVTQSPVLTVDTLPSGQYAVAGFRAFVSDANLAPVGNFGEIVGNSGSNTVCVWCDGTNWRIG
jgi:hypothetical protein